MLNKKNEYVNIIFLSSEWEGYHRKAYTEELVKNLNTWSNVVLLQLPVSLFVHFFTKFRKKVLGLFIGKYKTAKVAHNCFLFTPVILFHYLLWNKKIFFIFDNYLLNKQVIRFIKKNFGLKKYIIWYYFPFQYNYVVKSSADLKIYDQYDIYHMDIKGNINKSLESVNNKLIKISDVVFCTSEYLYNLSVNSNKNSYYITNGNSFEILSVRINEKAPIKMPIENSKTIGYLGGIRDWVDFELLNFIVKQRQNINYLFIGNMYNSAKREMEELKKFKNVVWVDYIEQDLLPRYLSLFNVGIIPFKTTEFFKSVFPNKFFEYLASGIPVVCTELIELKKYEEIIGYSANKEDFLKNCDLALSGFFSEYFDEYQRISKENSWFNKTKEISDIIEKKFLINNNDLNKSELIN